MNLCPQPNAILVADDDPDDRKLVQEVMAEIYPHIPLHFACDGVELMNYLYRRAPFSDVSRYPIPALILLDLNMPRQSGREALRAVRSDPDLRTIPVVIWTTSCAVDDANHSYLDGAVRFVTKPNSFDLTQKVLREIVGAFLPHGA